MKLLIFLALSVTLTWVLAEKSELEAFAVSSRQFGQDVYNEVITDNNENIIVSPFSAEAILALTQAGAVGTTAAEIRSTLHLPETEEETEALIKSVVPSFKNEYYTVKTANKVYVEKSFEIRETFKSVAADVYQADFQNVQFAENVGAAEIINSWVEEQTNNKIRNLISPNSLDASTRLVLVNALYLQANWSVPFNSKLTRKTSFQAPNKKIVKADFMTIERASLNYYEDEELDAKILELPFRGPDASMTIILPNKPEGIAVLEKRAPNLLRSPKYTKEIVRVLLPKFKIETTIDFTEILQNLGVHAAFNGATADFSGIAGAPGDLVISKVTQKAFVDVNEGGIEAAAATSVTVGLTASVDPPPVPRYNFIADHPFIFYIKVNDVILFEGRVLEPKYD